MVDETIKCTVTVSEVNKSEAEEIIGHSVTKEDDLFTNNFGRFLAAWIRPVPAGQAYVYESGFTTVSNTTIDLGIGYARTATNRWNYGYPGGTIVAVGTDSSAPARSDYKLGAQVGPWTKTLISSQYLSSTAQIVFAGDVYMSSDQNVNECGMGFVLHNFAAVDHAIMWAHDVLPSTVAVTSGNYARVTYRIGI